MKNHAAKTKREKVYFLSDLHLGASYFPSRLDAERRVVAFLDSIKDCASEVYLLGDVLDYWFEYRHVVPRGYVRFFGKLAELADSGVKITWMIGNHDIWIFDYIPSELGVEVIDGKLIRDIKGKRFFLTHGDGYGKRTRVFKTMRAVFRNRLCQKLYSGIHPRWTIPFAFGWSCSSRKTESEKYALAQGREGAESLLDFATEYRRENSSIDYYIFGHVHFQSCRKFQDGGVAITLGGWITEFDYVEFDGQELNIGIWNG